jgi:hypothetical protein
MSMKLDAAVAKTGTKFLVFPQPRHLEAFRQPEEIRLSIEPNQIQAGPADDRIHVIDAINKRPYGRGEIPPYTGPANPLVQPGPQGHFTHLQPGTREFSAAHMYAVVRRVLDIWEDYFNDVIPWHFEDSFARLLLIPLVRWNNAQSGYGFLEFGYASSPGGLLDLSKPYCENFDVLAHELGHSIIFSRVGFPSSSLTNTAEYGGFHESAGDLVAILSALHSHKVVDHLLLNTHGNLFTVNELERVGELSDSVQIRAAFNGLRMSDVQGEEHDLSQPLTGAIFDIFVEIFQKELVSQQLISQSLADRSFNEGNSPTEDTQIQVEFDRAYAEHEADFKTALLNARDYLGQLLAKAWGQLSPDFLTYAKVAAALLATDRNLTNGQHQQTIRSCMSWRQISLLSNPFAATPHRFI